jgi:hypothetical protein
MNFWCSLGFHVWPQKWSEATLSGDKNTYFQYQTCKRCNALRERVV